MSPTRKKQRRGLIILTMIFALIITSLILIWSSNTHITKSKYEIESSILPSEFDGFKIVQLSDLHVKEFGENNSRLINAVQKEAPDIVVLTGDMINSTDTPSAFDLPSALLETLASEYDTYYVDGNHETAMDVINSDYYDEWISLVKDAGVTILDNRSTSVEYNGTSIDIYGLWYNGRYYNNMGDNAAEKYYLTVKNIEQLLGTSDPSKFNLLLTHNPVYFQTYADWGADLTLAGHMHGGVIRIPFKGGLISPERVYWPEFDAGEFTVKNSDNSGNKTMIVNRGLGNGTSGYRIMNWPDVSVITLKGS